MHNKNKIPLLYLLMNFICARSTTHMLSLKNNYTLHFLNFVIIGLCNSSANFWFDIFFLIVDLSGRVTTPPASTPVTKVLVPVDFLSKNCKPLKQDLFDIYHTWGFSNIKCFIT